MQTMVRPKGFVEGTVQTAEPRMVEMDNGNSFAEFRVWLEPRRKASGKIYHMEVIVRIYGKNAMKATGVKRNHRVKVSGDFDVETTYAADGKAFNNLVVMARDYEEVE